MATNILFLCTGNSARSQMGEALLRSRAGERFNVFSAGTDPKDELFPPVVRVMREIGLDISGRKPKGVEEYLAKVHFEKVIIVCANAEKNCPSIFGFSQRVFWPFDDPAKATGTEEHVLSECRRVRDEIDGRICEWLKEEGIPVQSLPPAGPGR